MRPKVSRDVVDSDKTIVVIYNRVPKCGSTVMLRLLRKTSEEYQKFIYKSSPNYFHYRFTGGEQRQLPLQLAAFVEKSKYRHVVFNQHFHFFPMASTIKISYKFINLVRDPFQQALSAFEYMRYLHFTRPGTKDAREILPSATNLTMEECIQSGDPARCLTIPYGSLPMISYFCGQSRICDDTHKRAVSPAALSLAKTNIERYYTWVGVLEYMESSLELLESLLPTVFRGLAKVHQTIMKRKRSNETPEEYRNPLSNKTRAILLNLLQPDYELYDFIRQRFIDQYRNVFHKDPIPSHH